MMMMMCMPWLTVESAKSTLPFHVYRVEMIQSFSDDALENISVKRPSNFLSRPGAGHPVKPGWEGKGLCQSRHRHVATVDPDT